MGWSLGANKKSLSSGLSELGENQGVMKKLRLCTNIDRSALS